jgi:RND family efflux transporter MFP subunit
VTAVQVATAVSGAAVSDLSLSGTVTSSQSVTISPSVAGRVSSVAVALGQAVQVGQVLVRLGNPVLQAQLAEAKAAVASAQAKLSAAAAGPSPQAVAVAQAEVAKAQVALQAAEQSSQQAQTAPGKGQPGSSSAGSPSQATEAVSEAQAALTLAQAQAAQAEAPPSAALLAPLQAAVTQADDAEAVVEAQIAQESVTAPFAGVVSSLTAAVGEQVTPASTLLTLDGAAVSVQAPVAESDLGLIHLGEAATISSPSGGGSVPASVSTVAPTGNPSSLTFGVTISPVSDPPWLVPGEAVTAAVVTGRRAGAVLVPSSAVVSINGHPQVFVVHADHAVSLVDVTPGISDGTTTAVAGLGAGSEVVTLGQTYLAPGDRVRVTERASTPATVTGSSIGGLLTAPVAPTRAGATRRSSTAGTAGTAGTGSGGSTATRGGRGGRKG